MASRRRGGKASAKRRRAAASARRRADERAGIDRRGAYLSSGGSRGDRIKSRTATGGTSTGRESGIAAANTYDRNKKERSLEQSVGSLDRRVKKALESGNTDLAKDLRSRQNNFVKQLGLERARKIGGGTIQGNIRTSDGRRPLTTAGFNEFQRTVDQDFLDPTRRLQNLYPEQAREMYPVESRLQMGLPTVQAIKALFGVKDKQIPYNLDDMPGVRYPLDVNFGAGEGEPEDPMNIADLSFTPETTFGPDANYEDPDIIMAGQEPEPQILPLINVEFGDRPVPDMAPFIDKETRNEVFAQDVDNLPANNFNELLEEFEKESAEYEKRKANEPTVADKYPYQVAGPDSFPSFFNLFGQNDVPNDQILVDALNADRLEDGTMQSVVSPTMEEPQMQLGPIPVEDFLVEQQAKVEQGKNNLKVQYPYLNDTQIDSLYDLQLGVGSANPTSLDSNPVEFDDYMIKRMF